MNTLRTEHVWQCVRWTNTRWAQWNPQSGFGLLLDARMDEMVWGSHKEDRQHVDLDWDLGDNDGD